MDPPHMAEQKQDDQLEPTYCSCVRIRDVALNTCQRGWTIGRSGERGPEISVLPAWHDDDDDDIYIYIYFFFFTRPGIEARPLANNLTNKPTLTKFTEKKLDGNYTRMLRAILNKSWRQHPTKQQLYGHLPPITKTVKITRTRHTGHFWRSRDELISDVVLWTTSHRRAKAGRPARIYIQQLCADTWCSPKDLPEAMDDREGWRERLRDIRADSATWWWWWWYTHTYTHIYIYIYIYIYAPRKWVKIIAIHTHTHKQKPPKKLTLLIQTTIAGGVVAV